MTFVIFHKPIKLRKSKSYSFQSQLFFLIPNKIKYRKIILTQRDSRGKQIYKVYQPLVLGPRAGLGTEPRTSYVCQASSFPLSDKSLALLEISSFNRKKFRKINCYYRDSQEKKTYLLKKGCYGLQNRKSTIQTL